jgi:ribonuclease D
MLQAVAELRGETLLGFDIESRPSFTKGRVYPPAILQLAGRHAVYIFQLRTLGLPPELTAILADARTVKAGVAIGRDVRELRQLREFEPRGFVDLGECAMRRDLKHHGLRGLAAILLGCRISKGPRMTNWERRELPEPALRYAATDAWIGRRIYEAMRDGGLLADIPHSFESPRGPSRKSLWTHARAAIARVIRRPGTPGFTPRERQARA